MLKSTHEGILKIGDTEISVAVLENGQRIITQSGVFQALDRPARGNARIDQIPTFMDAKNLQPYINQDLNSVINKVVYGKNFVEYFVFVIYPSWNNSHSHSHICYSFFIFIYKFDK